MKKTDRELIAEKNYAELYNRYIGKIIKESRKMPEINGMRDDFMQEAFFCVVMAVDGADLSRNFTSFNTLLHIRLVDLKDWMYREEYKDRKMFDSRALEDSPAEEDGMVLNSHYADMCKDPKSEVYRLSPERYVTDDKEEELEMKYHKFLDVLPTLHRQYVDLKSQRVPRKKMSELLGVGMKKLSDLDHESIMVYCEIFDTNCNGCRKPKLAQKVMNAKYQS